MNHSVLANMDADLREIREKIDNGTYTARANESKRCSGNHWNIFWKVFDQNHILLRNVYACVKCPIIIRSDLNKEGTGKLRCHHKQCGHSGPTIASFFAPEFREPQAKKFKTNHKKDVKDAVVKFVVNDVRPVDAITKIGLINLLALFTQLGAHYGQMNNEDIVKLLPSRYTVSIATSALSLLDPNDALLFQFFKLQWQL